MSFKTLQRHVARREHLFEARTQALQARTGALASTWRAGWTPGRIVIAGLAAGFLFGRAKPLQWAEQGGQWFKLLQMAAPLLASVQAAAKDDATP